MEYYLLQSGSNGNSCLIISNDTKILIDVGISRASLDFKLNSLGYSIEQIDAILITHEHIDHIKAIDTIDPKLIYATKETLQIEGFNYIKAYKMFDIGNVHIFPIPISHDVANGMGYILDDSNESLVYITDTGIVSDKNLKLIKNATHYVFESNYNKVKLIESNRPYVLKKRIMSDFGHLSNIQCGEALAKSIGPLTKSIVLAHISAVANNPSLALKEVKETIEGFGVSISNISIKASSREDIVKGGKDE